MSEDSGNPAEGITPSIRGAEKLHDDPRDEQWRCWCGAEGTCDELFADDFGGGYCGGLGVLTCQCGGVLCVCHNHGEIQCPGCPDCEPPDGDDWDYDVYDDDWDDDGTGDADQDLFAGDDEEPASQQNSGGPGNGVGMGCHRNHRFLPQ